MTQGKIVLHVSSVTISAAKSRFLATPVDNYPRTSSHISKTTSRRDK